MASAPSRSRQPAMPAPNPGITSRETMTGSSTVPAARHQMYLLLAAPDRRDLKRAVPAGRSATHARAWPGGQDTQGSVDQVVLHGQGNRFGPTRDAELGEDAADVC